MSSAKTPNNLTDEQDIVVREFLEKIMGEDKLWGQNTASRGQIQGMLLQLLGYVATPIGLRPLGHTYTFKLGQDPVVDDSIYIEDTGLVKGALANAETTDNADDSDEAGASESPSGDAVGDVLQQDV